MNRSTCFRPRLAHRLLAGAALALLAVTGCSIDSDPVKPAASHTQAPLTKKQTLGKNVALEVDSETGRRRVIVNAAVRLRDGQLEGFLTRAESKEHEYILAADCDARQIHNALLAAGAEAGKPVFFGQNGQYVPASGTKIQVSVRYKKNGKMITVPAQNWIRNAVTQKALEHEWVFGGSRLIADPEDSTKPPFYEANVGDLICVCNMPSAMLDLPIKNPNSDLDMRVYQAFTDRIPPRGTRVEVVLEPVVEKGNQEKPKTP